MTAGPVRVCIVGAGPRGLSVLERLCANAGSATVEVHLVDPYPPGPGRVWRTGQNRQLLMNTVASQVSMFTDDTVEMAGPVVTGPSLWGWARRLAGAGHGLAGGTVPEWARREASVLGPDSYPSRALYGVYLGWVFQHLLDRAPAGVSVHCHRARAVRLQDGEVGGAGDAVGAGGAGRAGRTQRVWLDDGRSIDGAHAVVLTQGHLGTTPTAPERVLRGFAHRNGLRYVRPANPGEVDLGAVQPGERVFLRGLGLSFFDYLALLTVGRGGVFERAGGHLRYLPSGREPMLYAGSRRGLPHRARGANQKGAFGRHQPRVLTAEVARRLRASGAAAGGIDFRRDVWPLIAKETETVYYATLLAGRLGSCAVELFREMYLPLPWGGAAEEDLLGKFDVPRAARWDWQRVIEPLAGRDFADRAAFRDWLLDDLRADLVEARGGNVGSPLKAALDVLRDLRNEIRLTVDHGGLSGRSHREDLDGWYTPLNAYLSIGPPARRVEEAIALAEAGLLEFVGARVRLTTDPAGRCFVVTSAFTGGDRLRVTTVIEARMSDPDLRRTTDPLLRDLLRTGQARTHRIADGPDGYYETGGLAVTTRPYQVLDAAGVPHPGRFAFGVPTESVHWVTAAGIRPGSGSVSLSDSDAIARRVLGRDARDDVEAGGDRALVSASRLVDQGV